MMKTYKGKHIETILKAIKETEISRNEIIITAKTVKLRPSLHCGAAASSRQLSDSSCRSRSPYKEPQTTVMAVIANQRWGA